MTSRGMIVTMGPVEGIGSARSFVIAGIPDLERVDADDRARQSDGSIIADRQAGSGRPPLVALGSVSARLTSIGSVRAPLIASGRVGRRPCGMMPAGHVALMVTM